MSNINEMNVGPRWYVAHTYSGYENKVKANLGKLVENRGLGDLIFDCRIPVEIVIEKKGDVEKEVEHRVFPCYVYIKMVMNDETWHAVRNIAGADPARRRCPKRKCARWDWRMRKPQNRRRSAFLSPLRWAAT